MLSISGLLGLLILHTGRVCGPLSTEINDVAICQGFLHKSNIREQVKEPVTYLYPVRISRREVIWLPSESITINKNTGKAEKCDVKHGHLSQLDSK